MKTGPPVVTTFKAQKSRLRVAQIYDETGHHSYAKDDRRKPSKPPGSRTSQRDRHTGDDQRGNHENGARDQYSNEKSI